MRSCFEKTRMKGNEMIPKDPDLNLGNNNYDIKNDNNFIDCNPNLPNIPPCDMITLMGWVSLGFFKNFKCIYFIYLFGCARSWLWHAGSSIFLASDRIFTCGMGSLGCGL